MTIENFVEDIESIRTFLGIQRITVLGHSWGGHLALVYAIKHPQEVEKLVLIGPCPSTTADYALFKQEWIRRLEPLMDELHKLEESDLYRSGDPATCAKCIKMIYRQYCFHPEDAEKMHFLQTAQAFLNGRKVHSIMRENYFAKPFDYLEDLRKLRCKALIVHGAQDAVPLETAIRTHEALLDSKLVIIDHCGHFPFVEQKEQMMAAILEFLVS